MAVCILVINKIKFVWVSSGHKRTVGNKEVDQKSSQMTTEL